MDQQNLEQMIKDTLASLISQGSAGAASSGAGAPVGGGLTARDYPLGEKSPEKLSTPTGKPLSAVTLEGVINGTITPQDVRIRPETLEMQAQVADSVGRKTFAANLRRAAELIPVPDERILEIYIAMRPYHSTKQELYAIAEELEGKYKAVTTAKLVRESADVCEARGRLRKA
jgi:propanediol dehydratase small subunit